MNRPVLIAACLCVSIVLASGCSRDGGGGNGGDGESMTKAPKMFEVPGDAADAGCVASSYTEQEPLHLETGDEKRDGYTSDPPTTGAHWPLWPRWGLYDEQIQDEYAVHSLEHGGNVIWYGDVGDEVTATLPGLAEDEPKIVTSPRDGLDGLAATAWQQLLVCPQKAVDTLGADAVGDLLGEWIDKTGSTGSSAEKDAPAQAPPMSEFDSLPDQPPGPAIDTTLEG